MKLQEWEVFIQQIIEESNREPNESGKQRVLLAWRKKLEKDPHVLQHFQIDEIVREVRNRLKSSSRQASSSSPVTVNSPAPSVVLE